MNSRMAWLLRKTMNNDTTIYKISQYDIKTLCHIAEVKYKWFAVVQHDRTLRAVVVPGLCGRAVGF